MVGERIRKIIDSKGWTQVDLSEKTGIGQAHLSRIVSGKLVPNLKTLERIAEALEVPVAALHDEDVTTIKRVEHFIASNPDYFVDFATFPENKDWIMIALDAKTDGLTPKELEMAKEIYIATKRKLLEK